MRIHLQIFASTYTKQDQNTTSNTTSNSRTDSYSVTNNAAGPVDANTQQKYDKYKEGYTPSGKVNDAYKYLQDTLNGKPGSFSSQYKGQLDSLYDKVLGRKDFSYDMNKDLLYQQYRDQYTKNGRKAMQDTLGQAAALTGGYNNSYAQQAAQQTYDSYLGEVNAMVPELYQKAFDRYQAEGDELYDMFSMAKSLYEQDYGEHRDKVSDWQSDRNYAQGAYESARDFDYNDYANMLNFWQQEYWNQRHSVSKTESHSDTRTDSTTTSNSHTSSTSSGSGSGSSSKAGKSEDVKVSTYSEACAYLRQKGATSTIGHVMTQNEFDRKDENRKKYGSYKAYLNYMCNL